MTYLSQPAHHALDALKVGGAWIDFLSTFEWHYYVSLTHRNERTLSQIEAAVRSSFLRRLSRTAQGPLGWFFAIEHHHASRAHAHALIHSPRSLILDQVARAWKFGFADVRHYDRSRGAGAYVTKEIQLEGAIYDLSPRLVRYFAPGSAA